MNDDRGERRQAHPEAGVTSQYSQGSSRRPDDTDGGDSMGRHDPMTENQRSHLKVLSEQAGEPFDPNLTQVEAHQRIQELERRAGQKP